MRPQLHCLLLRLRHQRHHMKCSTPTCTSHVTCYTSHVTCYTSHVTHHTSHVTRHMLHVTHHTSHVTRHTSHVTRHTSHITHHALHFSTSGVVVLFCSFNCTQCMLVYADTHTFVLTMEQFYTYTHIHTHTRVYTHIHTGISHIPSHRLLSRGGGGVR